MQLKRLNYITGDPTVAYYARGKQTLRIGDENREEEVAGYPTIRRVYTWAGLDWSSNGR